MSTDLSSLIEYHLAKKFFSLLSSGRVTPINYSEIFTLDNLAEGLNAIEQRRTWGKAIVRIQEPPAKTAAQAKL